eukprot:gene32344-39114_t
MLVRLVFHRGLASSILLSSSVTCELKISTEFNEVVETAKICDANVAVRFVEAQSPEELRIKLQEPTQISEVTYEVKHKNKGFIAQLLLNIPTNRRMGYFLFTCENSEDVDILPLLSDLVTIAPASSTGPTISLPMLSNHRIFHISNDPLLPQAGILIRESYGELLGTHVYDCSVLLLSHILTVVLPHLLSLLHTDESNRSGERGVVVWELGAGLGLVSIGLARCLADALAAPSHTPTAPQPEPASIVTIRATDVQKQLPALRRNLAINGWQAPGLFSAASSGNGDVRVEVGEFDWTVEEQVLRCFPPASAGSFPLVLLAGDIFYSSAATLAFVQLLCRLADTPQEHPAPLHCYVAQKHRPCEGLSANDIEHYQRQFEDLSAEAWRTGGCGGQVRCHCPLLWECSLSKYDVNIWHVHT